MPSKFSIKLKKFFKLPIFSDLVEENVKHRCVFPLVIFAVYILLVFIILAVINDNDNTPSSIDKKLDLTFNYYFSENFAYEFPNPRIKVLTQTGDASTNVNVNFVITDLAIDENLPSFTCDKNARSEIAGTLNFYRMCQVCKIVQQSNYEITDENGYAIFSNIALSRGPEGNYGYQYASVNGNASSDEQYTYINSEAATLKVVEGFYPPINQTIGIPFSVQPRVLILDEYGNPLSGKYVIAVSWPEPFVPRPNKNENQEAYIDAAKYAYLEGDVSDPSDEDGIALFRQLTVKGSTSQYIYLMFVCESKAKTLWGFPKPFYVDSNSLPFYVKPIKLLTNATSVIINNQPLSSIIEGVEFGKNAPKIQVLNSNKTGIPGKLVIALICSFNNRAYTLRYSSVDKGYIKKRLINPFPGNYNSNSWDPLNEGTSFIPVYTDSKGYVSFNTTSFSIFGPYGNYKIEFICDGINVISSNIQVLSTVRKMEFVTQPPAFFSTDANDMQTDFVPVLRVSNLLGETIMGKTPVVEFINTATKTDLNPETELNFQLDVDNPLFTYSDTDGIIQLYFRYGLVAQSITFFKIKINMEGQTVTSREIKFQYIADIESCGYLKLVSAQPNRNILNFGDSFSMKFLLMSNFLNPLYNATVLFDLFYLSAEITSTPSSVIPEFRINVQTDNQGYAQINNLSLSTNGMSSIYYIKVIAIYPLVDNFENNLTGIIEQNAYDSIFDPTIRNYYDVDSYNSFIDGLNALVDDEFIDYCFADLINFTLVSMVGNIQLLNNTQVLTPYKTNTYYYFRVRIFSTSNIPLSNTSVSIDFNLIHFPSYLLHDYIYPSTKTPFKNTLITFSQLSKKTDKNGEILLKLSILPNFIGYYALTFVCQGVLTEPLEMVTEFLPYVIYIAEQPSYDYSKVNSSDFTSIKQYYQRSGDFLPAFRVLLNGYLDNPLYNYPIVAKVAQGVDSDPNNGIIDISEIFLDSGLISVLNLNHAFTKISGIADFYKITTFDIKGRNVCIRFQFFCGDSMNFNPNYYTQNMIINTSFSNPFCFYDESSVEFSNNTYTKKTAAETSFSFPIKANYQRTYLTDLDFFSFGHLTLSPFQIDDYRVDSVPGITTYNDICTFSLSNSVIRSDINNIEYYSMLKIPSSDSICDVTIKNYNNIYQIGVSRINEVMMLEYQDVVNQTILNEFNNAITPYNKNISFQAQITFTDFRWSGSSRKINFQLCINTLQNALLATDILPQSVFDQIQQLPIQDLYGFYKNCTLPPDVGTIVVEQEITALSAMNADYLKQISASSLNQVASQAKVDVSMLFSKSFSVKSSLISLLKSNMKNVFTDTIYVSSDVDSLEIIMDVPSIITIGDIFQASVKATKESDLGMPRVTVTASITSASDITSSLHQNGIENMISSIGDGQFSMDNVASLLKVENNIELDSTKNTKQTNNNGIAFFNLLIISGQSGTYRLIFSASGCQSKLSSTFIFKNPINSVSYFNNISQTIELTSLQNRNIYLSIQPILKLNYQDQPTLKDKLINVLVYKYFDFTASINNILNSSNQTYQSFESFYGDYKQNISYSNSSSAMDTISKMWKTVSGAGRIKNEATQDNEPLSISFTTPQETSDAKFIFFDLGIGFKEYGKYQLLFSVDGIETLLSDVIEIKLSLVIEQQDYIQETFITVLLIISAVILLLSNISIYDVMINVNSILVLIILMIAVDSLADLQDINQMLIYVVCGLLIIISLEIILDSYKKYKKEKNSMFGDVKNLVFYEYTYQLLFDRPSCFWEDYVSKKRKIKEMNIIPKKEVNWDRIKNISIQLQKQIDIPKKFEQKSVSFSEYEFPAIYPTPKNNKPLVSFESKSIKQKLKEVFFPFVFYQNELHLKNVCPIYYPQKVFAALLCAVASTIYMAYFRFNFVISLYETVYDMNFKVFDCYMEFMNKGFTVIKNSGYNSVITEDNFSTILKMMDFIRAQFREISRALEISFILGVSIASLLVLISFADFLIDFKARIISMRKGKYLFDPKKIGGMTLAVVYPGLHISNTIISFHVIMFVIGFVTFPLFWPLFWMLIYQNLGAIILLISSSILKPILMLIGKKFAVSPASVKNRRFLSLLDFVMVYLGMVAGIVGGIVRFIIGLVVSILTFSIVSEPLLPAWLSKILITDRIWKSYAGLLFMHHCHNNPIFLTFAKLISPPSKKEEKSNFSIGDESKESSLLLGNKKLKIKTLRNKFYLLFLMSKLQNHDLKSQRKTNLIRKSVEIKIERPGKKGTVFPIEKITKIH